MALEPGRCRALGARSCELRTPFSPEHVGVAEGEARAQLGVVLAQAFVARILVPKDVLERVERMLNLGAQAGQLGISDTTVLKVWRCGGPTASSHHLAKTFRVSRDPRFVEKLEDIGGLLARHGHLDQAPETRRLSQRARARGRPPQGH